MQLQPPEEKRLSQLYEQLLEQQQQHEGIVWEVQEEGAAPSATPIKPRLQCLQKWWAKRQLWKEEIRLS
eukprot:4043598-Ditylum_brightwellii.AAC.2